LYSQAKRHSVTPPGSHVATLHYRYVALHYTANRSSCVAAQMFSPASKSNSSMCDSIMEEFAQRTAVQLRAVQHVCPPIVEYTE